MASVATQLRDLRLRIEELQVEVAGRSHITSMVVWDEQNQSSVNSKTSQIQEDFSGLIDHLTPELSAQEETVGVSQNEFNELKQRLLHERSVQLGEAES